MTESEDKKLDEMVKSLGELVKLTAVSSTLQVATLAISSGVPLSGAASESIAKLFGHSDAEDDGRAADDPTAAPSKKDDKPGGVFDELTKMVREIMEGIKAHSATSPGGRSELEVYAREQRQGRTMSAFGRAKYQGNQWRRWAGRMVGGRVGKSMIAAADASDAATSTAAGEGTGGAIASIGGAATVAIAGIYELGKGAYKAYEAIVGWTTEALESARKLGEVSGSMAAVFAQKDINDMLRDIKHGEEISGSTERLMNSEADRKDAALPIVTALDNAQNNILAMLNDVLVPILGVANSVLEVVKDIARELEITILEGGEEPEPLPLAAEMDRMLKMSDKIEAEGKRMMNAAKQAAAVGTVSPWGAAGPGKLP